MTRGAQAFIAILAVFVGLLVAPASATVRPALSILPDGDTRPEIHAAELLTPQPHNALLEADLEIDASDNDAVSRYEYRWNSATFGSVVATSVDNPVVSYSSIRPDTRYALEIRAVDIHNNASPWYQVWSGVTPGPPQIVIAGDSIASGYTRQFFTRAAECRNAALSYGRAVASILADSLPDQWVPTYTNIAWAGAGVQDVLTGGRDSCGANHPSQVDQIVELAESDSWNIVVMTVGINTTNWTNVVVGLTRDTVFSLTERGDQRACRLALDERWNIDNTRSSITQGASITASRLLTRTNARVFWTSYYDISGTELAPLWTPIGLECEAEFEEAIAELHSALRADLDPDVVWVDIDQNVETQTWAGWPHPDVRGHERIGETIAAAILP